jgi:hypothetical protein
MVWGKLQVMMAARAENAQRSDVAVNAVRAVVARVLGIIFFFSFFVSARQFF